MTILTVIFDKIYKLKILGKGSLLIEYIWIFNITILKGRKTNIPLPISLISWNKVRWLETNIRARVFSWLLTLIGGEYRLKIPLILVRSVPSKWILKKSTQTFCKMRIPVSPFYYLVTMTDALKILEES